MRALTSKIPYRLAFGAGFVALWVALSGDGPTEHDPKALAAVLGEAIRGNQAGPGHVDPRDVRWEPSDGIVSDYLFGRWALFLGSEAPGAPRDVYRARVRLTPEGRPIAVRTPYALTSTPLGDDHALVIHGERAAFATLAYGQEQSVSVLDLAKDGARAPVSLSDRAMMFLTNVQQTGAGDGVGRVDITLDPPARAVGLAIDGESLRIERLQGEGTEKTRFDLARGEIETPNPALHAEAVPHLPKRFVFWAVDTVRAISWVGPAPIAWLEDKVFGARDALKQFAFKLHGSGDASGVLADAPAAKASVLKSSKAADGDAEWPPADMPSIWKTPEPGEGTWQVPKMPWMKKLPGTEVPAPFVRTFVRPDEQRPYASVILVAMDMRQLELQMEAGTEDPKPLTGGHGPGRIPRDPAIAPRVVAAFNGAFKTEHGMYGMMVHKRVLLPPQPGAATVVVTNDGRMGMGTWGNTTEVTGIHGVPDTDIDSFRQNLDPLLDRGEINPTKRALWGYTLPGNGTQTERSGICVTEAGHLVYAWGAEVSATVLAKAMKMAGCAYGMHLDMNPHHTGFLFTRIDDVKAHKFRSEILASEMEISNDRYIDYAAKDFFYVLLRDPTPPSLEGVEWKANAGTQPAPSWLTAMWEAHDGQVELLDIEPRRARFRIRAGTKEPDSKTGATPTTELGEEDAERVLFALSLGNSLEKHPRGLVTAGKMVLPMRGGEDSAVLLASGSEGELSIVKTAEMGSELAGSDVAELPLLIDGGAVLPSVTARHTVHGPRAALGITPEGRIVVAKGTFASDAPLANALRKAGCTRAVALDRGTHEGPTMDRAGTSSPPRAHYETTVLYGMGRPFKPRGFRFDAASAVADRTTVTTRTPN
ncbi:phosphodiester glycosidase family protein [Pendulispora brunnea]|uniref:Phosphodiester glycosidase family protein n=1 Tax=Pendulispora brunnea TaxID=2905690 RepID=A0ABZ2K342_9BACT